MSSLSSSEEGPNETFQAWLDNERDRRLTRSRGLEFSSRSTRRYENSTPEPLSSWACSETELPRSDMDTSSSDDSTPDSNTSTSPCPSEHTRSHRNRTRTYVDKDLKIGTNQTTNYPFRSRLKVSHRKNILKILTSRNLTSNIHNLRSSTFTARSFKVSKFVRPYHSGCVNAIDWNKDGSLLASSGDDLNVHINLTNDLFTPSLRPEMDHNRNAFVNFETSHTSNVFQCRFQKTDQTKIITTGRDGRVLLHDYESRRTLTLLDRSDEEWSGSIQKFDLNVYFFHFSTQ